MFDTDTQTTGSSGVPQTVDAEFTEIKRFQWVVPFLGGVVVALFIAALIIAAYLLKMGPFSVSDRQTSIESAVANATDEVDRQVDEAAVLQQTATLDPALSNQAINVAGMQFGPVSAQAIAQLTVAETNGQAKCKPALATLAPEARTALTQVTCALIPAQAAGAAPAPATQPSPATITLSFANGRLAALNYALSGADAPAPAGDAMPTAPAEPTPPVEAAPAAPAETPQAAGDAPPT